MSTHFRSSFRSSDKAHDIAYYVVFPKGNVRGVVQIVHGMAEYFERYNAFADFLAGYELLRKNGVNVCVHIIDGLPGETHEMMLETCYCALIRITRNGKH